MLEHTPGAHERGAQIANGRARTRGLGDQHDIDRRQAELLTKRLAHMAFDAIPDDGLGTHLARHRDPDARATGVVGARIGVKQGASKQRACAQHAAKQAWRNDTASARKLAARRAQCYALSLRRPLARRALSTARPEAVAMRARKPCVRLRLMTLGWNVRFMAALEKCQWKDL